MTRGDFIKLVKGDQHAQIRQVAWLMVTIAIFGGIGTWVANSWEEQMLNPGRPYLWLMCGLALLFAVVAVAVVRLGGKSLLKCPHCRKCLGGHSSQVVVATGCCGFCGERIISDT